MVSPSTGKVHLHVVQREQLQLESFVIQPPKKRLQLLQCVHVHNHDGHHGDHGNRGKERNGVQIHDVHKRQECGHIFRHDGRHSDHDEHVYDDHIRQPPSHHAWPNDRDVRGAHRDRHARDDVYWLPTLCPKHSVFHTHSRDFVSRVRVHIRGHDEHDGRRDDRENRDRRVYGVHAIHERRNRGCHDRHGDHHGDVHILLCGDHVHRGHSVTQDDVHGNHGDHGDDHGHILWPCGDNDTFLRVDDAVLRVRKSKIRLWINRLIR